MFEAPNWFSKKPPMSTTYHYKRIYNSSFRVHSPITQYSSAIKQTKQKNIPQVQIIRFKIKNKEPARLIQHKQQKNIFDKRHSSLHKTNPLPILNDNLNNNIEHSKRYKLINNNPYYAVSKQGKRPYNQDRYVCINQINKFRSTQTRTIGFRNQYDYYAVFDGHGGSLCAQFMKENLHKIINGSKNILIQTELALKQSFEKAQLKFLQICQQKKIVQTSGACALVCLVLKQNIYFANLGDCRGILLDNEQGIQMTKDHKPYDSEQKMRIIRCGGKISKQIDKNKKGLKILKQTRIIPGNLNVSRTFGDIEVKYKKYGGLPGMIVAEPTITHITRKKQSQVVLLASDGLFQALSSRQIHNLYCQVLAKHSESPMFNLIAIFTQQLINLAETISTDNITIVTILV